MTGSENLTSRALKSADLNAVVDIDQRIVGYSRRGFFEKRLEAAVKSPKDYIVIGVTEESNLVGFTFARLHEGDFGTPGHFAALDAIGVDPRAQAHGVGKLLMDALEEVAKKKNVCEIRTQSDWRYHSLVKFLDAMGFEVAPVHVLERQSTASF